MKLLPAPRPFVVAALLAVQIVITFGQAPSAIPERPETLSFPPLDYEPPVPSDYRVQLKSGPVAYVVPDRELPLVNLVIYVRAGSYLDPAGQEGLADVTGHLLARGGTLKRTAEELEERLDFLAAELDSTITDTHGTISLNLLAKDLPEGVQILREVLSSPRFQEDKLALRKRQVLQSLKQRNDDPQTIESRERRFLSYGETFWINRLPTAPSIESISQADVRAFHKKWIAPGNFIIAVNGDFEREQMVATLEGLFGGWPFSGEKTPPIPTNTTFATAGAYLVNKDVNQGRVSVLLPGIRRDDPDYHAVVVMNDILGGGGFTSRIMNRVRSEEGLAYSAASAFVGGVYFPGVFVAAFQSKSRTVAYALSLVLQEIKRIAAEPVSDEELTTAKQGLIDSFPATFATKTSTANIFAQDELTGRYAKDPTYWKDYRARIAAISKNDVQQAARKHLKLEKLVILAVGQKAEIIEGHPNYPVTFQSLIGTKLVDLPLRDPLTLKPLSAVTPE